MTPTLETYIVADDGKNKSNIEGKGLGIVSHILDILKSVSSGIHYFEIAVNLIESILINGMLTKSEVWYGLTETEVGQSSMWLDPAQLRHSTLS